MFINLFLKGSNSSDSSCEISAQGQPPFQMEFAKHQSLQRLKFMVWTMFLAVVLPM